MENQFFGLVGLPPRHFRLIVELGNLIAVCPLPLLTSELTDHVKRMGCVAVVSKNKFPLANEPRLLDAEVSGIIESKNIHGGSVGKREVMCVGSDIVVGEVNYIELGLAGIHNNDL